MYLEAASLHFGSLAHDSEPVPFPFPPTPVVRSGGVKAPAVIFHRNLNLPRPHGKAYPHLASLGVLSDIGHGLLDDAHKLHISRAFPMDHSTMANMKRASGIAPGTLRRLHATSATGSAMIPLTMNGKAYGV